MDPTPNGGRDRFSKWPIFDLPEARDLDLDLGSGSNWYVMYNSLTCTHIPSLVEIGSKKSGRTDVRTYVRTDGHRVP